MSNRKTFISKVKSWKLLLPLLVLLTGSSIGGVYAWYSSTSIIENPMHTGYDVKLEEVYDPDPEQWHAGEPVTKSVSVTNYGTTDAFLRMYYTEVWEETGVEDGGLYTTVIDGKETVVKHWDAQGLTSDSPDWTYNSLDGYYYYNYILKPGDKVEVLKSIQFNLETAAFVTTASEGNKTNEFTYHLDFVKESIQATEEASEQVWKVIPVVDFDTGEVTWLL